MINRTGSGEPLEERTHYRRDQAEQARRLLRRCNMDYPLQSSPLPEGCGTPDSSRTQSANSARATSMDRHYRFASWPPDRLEAVTSPSPGASPACSLRAPSLTPHAPSRPAAPAPPPTPPSPAPAQAQAQAARRGPGPSRGERPREAGKRPSPISSPFAGTAVQDAARSAGSAGPPRVGLQQVLSAPPMVARTFSDPMLWAPRTLTVARVMSLAPPHAVNRLAEAHTALKGLCGEGNQREKNNIDFLMQNFEDADTQRVWSSYMEDATRSAMVCRALQRACRRHWLHHPGLVSHLLRRAPWEPLLDDAQALTHIGAHIEDIDVFRALADREAQEHTHLLNGPSGQGVVREMAQAALTARRQVLWDSLLKPKADLLCRRILRAGRVEILESLWAYIPPTHREAFLKTAVSIITIQAYSSCTWLRLEVEAAGISVPNHLGGAAEPLVPEGVAEQIALTWRRGMQADEVARAIEAIERVDDTSRRHILHTLVQGPRNSCVVGFITQATDAERAVSLWGADLLVEVMCRFGEVFSCPLLAFGAPVAGVLLRHVEAPRDYVLVATNQYQPLWLALSGGQATLAATMFATISDARERDDVLARVRAHIGEATRAPAPGGGPRAGRLARTRRTRIA